MKKSPSLEYCTFPTPAGRFSVAVGPRGVAAAVFGGRSVLESRTRGARLFKGAKRTAAARRELSDFFAGRRRRFTVRVEAPGSAFQKRVWRTLLRIPYGQTRSYGQIARALGSSARAVGRANATNPVCVLVPCHRVIGADGSLTGYAFGQRTKRRLLRLEAP
ncbi:MAG TPA: methylated-DNA--[protein]-cysteine S-methyltransferase [Opitutaceae bacterium]|jgi:methylated-DNA-[protein]-cysteine S-methyltransferase